MRLALKHGQMLTPEEAAWLADYDNARQVAADAREGSSVGASRAHKVSFTEETREAVGEGSSAVAEVAAAGAMVREEGRRYDSLIAVGIQRAPHRRGYLPENV